MHGGGINFCLIKFRGAIINYYHWPLQILFHRGKLWLPYWYYSLWVSNQVELLQNYCQHCGELEELSWLFQGKAPQQTPFQLLLHQLLDFHERIGTIIAELYFCSRCLSVIVVVVVQSNKAKEMFLEMDLYDYVEDSCQWAEVSLTSLLKCVYTDYVIIRLDFQRRTPSLWLLV